MGRIGKSVSSAKPRAAKKPTKKYVKPRVTTLGSVSKLTLGANGSFADLMGTRHRHSPHRHGH